MICERCDEHKEATENLAGVHLCKKCYKEEKEALEAEKKDADARGL